ncbi:MAG: F0F1 ATP synthase subunit B [Candidatus Wildermuthbacteria bacterium]|nr:F0F1 ATP synthase subunit B [Candidatus Wildermuthbacteria bacterium]
MGELFEKLGINWKLLLAQAVNFLLVLFLLNHFVFKKLIVFLEERKKRIEQGIILRDKAERELQRTLDARHRELEGARKEAEGVVSKARAQAQQSSSEIVAQAKSREERMLISAKEQMVREKNAMVEKAEEEIRSQAVLFAEKILERTLNKKDQERMMKETLKELG